VKVLFSVPRTQLVLLPYYARLTAILSIIFKDITAPLFALLEEEFNFFLGKKDQTNLESKIRNIRFLSELTKFNLIPNSFLLDCFRKFLDDFTNHNIEIACNLLEVSGRFLYKSPESHVRCKNLLDVMMRLKNAKNLDNRLENLIENSYFHCIPPERTSKNKDMSYSPLQLFVKSLVFNELEHNFTANGLPKKNFLLWFRMLPWGDPELQSFLLKIMLSVHKGKYANIPRIAALLAAIVGRRKVFGMQRERHC
jgi:regulator of nonsense transcripts 2